MLYTDRIINDVCMSVFNARTRLVQNDVHPTFEKERYELTYLQKVN